MTIALTAIGIALVLVIAAGYGALMLANKSEKEE